MEELTAQFCEKMFSMEESMQPVLADVQQNHKGLWTKKEEASSTLGSRELITRLP